MFEPVVANELVSIGEEPEMLMLIREPVPS
jgi:hypothetical protein